MRGRGKDKENLRRPEKGRINIRDMGRSETRGPGIPAEEQALTYTFVIPVREQRKDFKVQRKGAKGTFQSRQYAASRSYLFLIAPSNTLPSWPHFSQLQDGSNSSPHLTELAVAERIKRMHARRFEKT